MWSVGVVMPNGKCLSWSLLKVEGGRYFLLVFEGIWTGSLWVDFSRGKLSGVKERKSVALCCVGPHLMHVLDRFFANVLREICNHPRHTSTSRAFRLMVEMHSGALQISLFLFEVGSRRRLIRCCKKTETALKYLLSQADHSTAE